MQLSTSLFGLNVTERAYVRLLAMLVGGCAVAAVIGPKSTPGVLAVLLFAALRETWINSSGINSSGINKPGISGPGLSTTGTSAPAGAKAGASPARAYSTGPEGASEAGLRSLLPSGQPAWLAILFAAHATLSAIWSLVPGAALVHGLYLVVVGLATFAVCRWIWTLPGGRLGAMARGLAIGVAVACGLLFVEILTDQALKRALFNSLEFLRSHSTKHYEMDGERILRIGIYVLNRGIAMANLLLWPALAVLFARGGRLGRWVGIALALALGVVTFRSDHQTSMIAFVCGGLVFALALWSVRAIHMFMQAAWALAVLAVVPLSLWAYSAGLHKSDWLPLSAKARLAYWGVTANNYLKAPIFGAGVRTTQELDRRHLKAVGKIRHSDQLDGTRMGRHAHNIYLQTWFELGAIGALLLLGFGLALINRLKTLNITVRPYAYATLAVAMVVAALTWGVWQYWYSAAFALAIIAVTIAAHPDLRGARAGDPV